MWPCGREFVICGDWNIPHREIDVKNWKTNQATTGFLPPVREWLTRVFEQHGSRAARIYTAEVFSDHAPVVIDYDYRLSGAAAGMGK